MILIVGGTGSLGSAVVDRLLAEGERVRVMTRTPAKAAELSRSGAEVVRGDLLDRDSLVRACEGVDQVVAAAHSLFGRGREASAHVDRRGHTDLIDVAKAAGVRHFIYTSVHDYGPAYRAVPLFRIKYQVEKHLEASGLSYTILRPTAFMEAHAHALIGVPILEKGKVVLFGSGERPRNFVAADDVAAFAVLALRNASLAGATLDVGGPENWTSMEVVRLYERLSRRTAKVTRVPVAVLRLAYPLLRPLHAGFSQVLQSAVVGETADQRFDAQRLRDRFPVQLTRLEAWASQQVRRRA